MLRHQLPVRSPVTLRTLGAGLLPGHRAPEELAGRIREEYGATEVLLTASGTVALALAFRASAPDGDGPVRVALPAWGCPDLMTAADAAEAGVLLYDLDPGTLAPDRESLRRALGEAPHAVVVAHWFGLPVPLAEIRREVEGSGAALIDDAAQAVGAVVAGRPAGAGGAFGALSFGRGKGRTGGGGGALLAFNAEAAEALGRVAAGVTAGGSGWRSLVKLGGQWALGRPLLYGLPARLPWLGLGETRYHPAPPLRGIAGREAAIVLAGWDASAAEVVTRRRNAARWQAGLSGSDGLGCFVAPAGSEGGWLRFPVRASGAMKRRLAEPALRRRGVMPGYPSLLSDLPLAPGRLVAAGATPGARELVNSLFTLPTHRSVSDSDFSHVFAAVQGLHRGSSS